MRTTSFLIDPSKTTETLNGAIDSLKKCSEKFTASWIEGRIEDAYLESKRAFELMDHIGNEILRHRDEFDNVNSAESNRLENQLNHTIGELIEDPSESDKLSFANSKSGEGGLPPSSERKELKLGVALNKVKHRSTTKFNFTISGSNNVHKLFVFTNPGMRKEASICSFDVQDFCIACSNAASEIRYT